MKSIVVILSFSTLIACAMAEDIQFTDSFTTKASPEVVWESITSPDVVSQYYLAPLRKIDLKKGGAIEYGLPNKLLIVGVVTEVEERKILSHTFSFAPGISPGSQNAPPTTVTYRISESPAGTVVALSHTGFAGKDQTYADISSGWPHILRALEAILNKP